MVDVLYDRWHNQVAVEGHAGDAPQGESLICAACSILLHTIVRNTIIWRDTGLIGDLRIKAVEGYGQVSYGSVTDGADECAATIEAICEGFRWLQEEYPEHVSYTRLG